MRQPLLTAVLLLLVITCLSCGGRSSQSHLSGQPATPIQLTAFSPSELPTLPQHDNFNLQRVSSSATASVLGFAVIDSRATSVANTSIELDSQASQVAYALYDFAGTPGEAVTNLSFTGHGGTPGSMVYAGISNYVSGKWDFFQPQTGAPTFTLDNTPGKYISPSGHCYVLAATFNNTFYTLDQVNLDFSARFTVSGAVVDALGAPVPGAVVGTPLGQQATVTDVNGNYSLALPNGTWPVMVTSDSWTFYSNPTVVTVNNSNVSNVKFLGRQQQSHFLPNETGPYNDSIDTAEPVDFSGGPITSTLSRIDDSQDFYTFTVATPGQYYLEFTNPNMDIYYPDVELKTLQGINIVNSASVLRGTTRIPVLVGQAPRSFILSVAVTGGGGYYNLALEPGTLQKLAVTTVPSLDTCKVTAHNTVTGDDTEYLTSYGYYADDFRAPVSTTVSVVGDGLSFVPASTPVDLSAGPQLSVNFVGNGVATSDSKEPNNTQVNADLNAVLPVTYNSVTAGDSLTVDSQADQIDYYKITPQAGKGMRIRIDYATPGAVSAPLYVALNDNLLNYVGTDFGVDENGEELRLPDPATGNAYYLQVSAPGGSDTRTYQYLLSVEVYDPVKLDYSAMIGAQPIQNASIHVRCDTNVTFGTRTTDAAGAARGLLCKGGEAIFSEMFRYGMNIDRTTKYTQIAASPVTVTFTADPALSADTGEYNDSVFSLPAAVPLPLTISAALNPDSDYNDCYKFITADANPVRVTLTESTSLHPYAVQLYDSVNNTVGSTLYLEAGKGPVYIATPGAGTYTLQLTYPREPALYTVDIDTAPAFALSGTVLSGGNPVSNTVVYCAELDRAVYCDFGNGFYTFGAVPPGTYTLSTFRGGFAPDQASKQGVVTNAAVNVNFTLTASGIDQNEPGDAAQPGATALVSGVLSSPRTIGDTLDSDDWYKFTATAGQLCDVRTTWGHSFLQPANTSVYDPASNFLGQGLGFNADQANYTFIAPATGTYYVDVNGGPTDYQIEVTVQ